MPSTNRWVRDSLSALATSVGPLGLPAQVAGPHQGQLVDPVQEPGRDAPPRTPGRARDGRPGRPARRAGSRRRAWTYRHSRARTDMVGWVDEPGDRGREPAAAAGAGRHGPRVRRTARHRRAGPDRVRLGGALHPPFRATFGETPHRYLQRRRVERAMFLLRSTDRSVTDICLEAGFTSLGTFSRMFREIVGEPPSGTGPADHCTPCRPASPWPWARPSSHLPNGSVSEKRRCPTRRLASRT